MFRALFWRPPLVPIVHPPDGFALQALVGTKLTISVAATVCRYYAGAAMADALVDVAVVMQAEDETQLLLDTRYDFGAAVARSTSSSRPIRPRSRSDSPTPS
ncbi:MAG: hypothetical protein M3N47_09940, partial [Chloroflexota bacterium]|nr:hypothetical protein [Chloroflexota bacterium]